MEDHPMVVEVWMPEDEIDNMERCGDILLCDHTIYLTPFSSKFIFFSKDDKNVAISLSVSSIETKYVDIYSHSRIVVERPIENGYEKIERESSIPFNEIALNEDTATNKMKGLLFGYYIGHLLSTDLSSIKQINSYRKMRDIFAAILSSSDREPTSAQMDTLNDIFSTLSPIYNEFLKVIKDKRRVLQLLEILRKLHYTSPSYPNLEKLLFGLKERLDEDIDKTNPSLEWINNKISVISNEIHTIATTLSVANPEILVSQYKLEDIKNNNLEKFDKQLLLSWMNDIFISSSCNGRICTINENLSDEITLKAKEILSANGDWDGSTIKNILNDLRRHVRGSEFEHHWGNDLYSAVAAVLTNGDDWHKLLLFMQSKEMTDYSLAFGIYGVLNGFAGLPRDFTDNLFNCDKKYLESIYEEFYGELFDKKLPRETKTANKEVVSPSIETKLCTNEKYPSLSTDATITTEAVPPLQQSSRFDLFFEELVKKVKSAKADKTIYEQYYTQYGMTEAFSTALFADKAINKGKGMLVTARKFIDSKIKSKQNNQKTKLSKNVTKTYTGKSLFDTEQTVDQLNYPFTADYVEVFVDLIRNKFPKLQNSTINNIKKDISWVLDYKYSDGKTSKELLEMVENVLIDGKTQTMSKNGKDMTWKNKVYIDINVNEIIDLISKHIR
jgi:hypothetical protein